MIVHFSLARVYFRLHQDFLYLLVSVIPTLRLRLRKTPDVLIGARM